MGETRRRARCESCGEVRELATVTECFMCYRRRQREADQVDRHNPGIRRDQKKVLSAHHKLMGALADLKLGAADVHRVLDIVSPYVEPVSEWLGKREREQSENVHGAADDDEGADDNDGGISDAEARELRRMRAEMENFPFVRHTFNYDVNGQGGTPDIVPGAAGAPVHREIASAENVSRRRTLRAIDNALAGKRTKFSERAVEVARGRLAGDRSLSRPWLPPDAGDLPGTSVTPPVRRRA